MLHFIAFIKITLASIITMTAGASIALTLFIFSDNIDHKVIFSSTLTEPDIQKTFVPLYASLIKIEPMSIAPPDAILHRNLNEQDDDDDDTESDCS